MACLCAGELSSLLEFTRLETGQPSLSSADDVTAAGAKKKLPFSTSFHDTSSGGWVQHVLPPSALPPFRPSCLQESSQNKAFATPLPPYLGLI